MNALKTVKIEFIQKSFYFQFYHCLELSLRFVCYDCLNCYLPLIFEKAGLSD